MQFEAPVEPNNTKPNWQPCEVVEATCWSNRVRRFWHTVVLEWSRERESWLWATGFKTSCDFWVRWAGRNSEGKSDIGMLIKALLNFSIYLFAEPITSSNSAQGICGNALLSTAIVCDLFPKILERLVCYHLFFNYFFFHGKPNFIAFIFLFSTNCELMM